MSITNKKKFKNYILIFFLSSNRFNVKLHLKLNCFHSFFSCNNYKTVSSKKFKSMLFRLKKFYEYCCVMRTRCFIYKIKTLWLHGVTFLNKGELFIDFKKRQLMYWLKTIILYILCSAIKITHRIGQDTLEQFKNARKYIKFFLKYFKIFNI